MFTPSFEKFIGMNGFSRLTPANTKYLIFQVSNFVSYYLTLLITKKLLCYEPLG